MRKLIYGMNLTLDGYIAAVGCHPVVKSTMKARFKPGTSFPASCGSDARIKSLRVTPT